jgi:hypothetical protein
MSNHLKACVASEADVATERTGMAMPIRLFLLAVAGTYATDYWMYLQVPASATLRELDEFLRGIWLECCGHLSLFRIHDQNFMVQVFDGGWGMAEDRDMNVELGSILVPGIKFAHEYDFGSTTYLTLRVVSEYEAVVESDYPIQVLARNEPPVYRCERCDQPAVYVDVFDDYALLCKKCDDTDGWGEGLMPLANSPRVGVCGYTGDFWAQEEDKNQPSAQNERAG